MQLCDTNVLSELSRSLPNEGVLAWASRITTIGISVVTLEEIFFGLAWRPAPRVAAWFDHFLDRHCQVLPITEEAAKVSGQLRGRLQAQGKPSTQADMLIAATAKVGGLTLVTRNVKDFEDCGVPLLNPFA